MCSDQQPVDAVEHDCDGGPSGSGGMPQPGVAAVQPGPDMGQPHFSAQLPGQAPYQGAPLAGAQGDPAQPGAAPDSGPQAAAGYVPGQTGAAGPAPGPAQENRYGELYGLLQDAANGNPDVNGFLNFFQTTRSDFWKGALVGAGVSLLLTNDTVKSFISKGFAGVLGAVGGRAEAAEAEEDRKAEQRAAKEATS